MDVVVVCFVSFCFVQQCMEFPPKAFLEAATSGEAPPVSEWPQMPMPALNRRWRRQADSCRTSKIMSSSEKFYLDLCSCS